MNSSPTNEPCAFELTEKMWGYLAIGAASYQAGYEEGKSCGNRLEYEVTLHVRNFEEFTAPSGRKAPMTGYVSCPNLFGEQLPIYDGEYGLYWIDPETGGKRISYRFRFRDNAGSEYCFSGYKVLVHEPWTPDLLEDQTTLFAQVVPAAGGTGARGIIHFHVEDLAGLITSIRTPDEDNLIHRMVMAGRFLSFVTREISDYVEEISPYYEAMYNNLVMRGRCSTAGGRDFEYFFFSGTHDKNFPWGDNTGFWDIGLVLLEDGAARRFALTGHSIDGLELRFKEGAYAFNGSLYEITAGTGIAFSEIHPGPATPHLRPVPVKIDLRFAPVLVETRNVPFEKSVEKPAGVPSGEWHELAISDFFREMESWRRDLPSLGYTTSIHRLVEIQGTLEIDGAVHTIRTGLGEGETGKLAGLKKPHLYYNYVCAIEPAAALLRVHARTGILRSLSNDLLVAEAEEVMGSVVGQISKFAVEVKDGHAEEIDADLADSLARDREILLEINNDQYPTGTFQRRVVALPGASESPTLAMEEDMSVIDLKPHGSSRTATVAAIKDPDRFRALDRVLAATDFFARLEHARSKAGRCREDFSIVIKPNFSFMYSLTDPSTFTDPALVEHLVDRLFEQGYRNIAVAEAHSTYSMFFTNRDVATLARYVGLKARNYRIVDLSENTVEYDYGRTLGRHEVHPVWRDADFRVSFAKNKTHSYAFYTLTLKNIYGALPRKNKFKEYHCNGKLGIYAPTIDYLEEFPVHFGLIDAYISADGPFGVFSNIEPIFTSTIIGGDDLVAVDWVGASKMGYDPMISDYMKLAVERFGKPRIRLTGDHSVYPGWRNVPAFVSSMAFGVMDRNYTFGSFLYSVMGSMDPFFSFKLDQAGRKVARILTEPFRKLLFQWVRGEREKLTWADLQKLCDPQQLQDLQTLMQALDEGAAG